MLAVYTGSTIDSLHSLTASADQACSDQSMVVFNAVSRTTYWIAVDASRDAFFASVPGTEGKIKLTITCDAGSCK